jgi:hypothetical protein
MPRVLPLSARSWLLLVSLAAGVGVAFLAVHPRHGEDPFRDKYEQVRLGMSEDKVRDLLGRPTHDEYLGLGFGGCGPNISTWAEGRQKICVTFDQPGVVVRKRFFTWTWWEKAWDELHRFLPSFR